MEQTACQAVRVFYKPEKAQGNQAAIIFIDKHVDLFHEFTEISTDITKHYDIDTTCFISQERNRRYQVNCFNGDNAIQCCGHGMIAAAKIIFSNCDLSNIIINENIIASQNIEEMGRNVVMLNLPRLSSHMQAVPGWANDCITFQGEKLLVNKAAVSAQDDGYLLLEFNPALSIEIFSAMQLNLKQVCENTKRAVVIMQLDHQNKHLYVRYFAPQYGVSEDTATGSVMRFVGDYIEKNYKISRFDVSQCSSSGGFMSITCKAKNIIITANARMEPEQ